MAGGAPERGLGSVPIDALARGWSLKSRVPAALEVMVQAQRGLAPLPHGLVPDLQVAECALASRRMN
jgi:hypothetical protein